jgi:pimeloyl-ACP methyl ester carboxylesterase
LQNDSSAPGVVLVHGAFVDDRCWEPVARLLRDRGRQVATVTLHRGSLVADTETVQEVVDRLGGRAVVCGWSYGGVVITGLELAEGSHLVYLCAVMPAEGESLWSLAGEALTSNDAYAVDLDFTDAGEVVVSGPEVNQLFWEDAPAELAELACESIRPQIGSTFFDVPERIAWRTTPSTYVIGRHDRVFNGEVAAKMAARATLRIEWDTSHSPNLARPDLVVDLIEGLLGELPGAADEV